MSTLVLIALLAAAFTIQHRLDVRNIGRVAEERHWSTTRITWTPWTRGSALRSRWERSYWLRYRDEHGNHARRRCWVTNPFDGPAGVFLEPPSSVERARGAPLGRLQLVAVATLAGGFIGAALGIGGSLLLFPSSNIAPAYGLFLMVPLGLGAGALFGVLRGR